MPVFKPPYKTTTKPNLRSIFLAGSIEMGTATKWQNELAEILTHEYNVFNPLRDEWDSSLKQEFENPQFSQQVNWELDHLEKADSVIFYFEPNTKSPITLLELGLMATTKHDKCIVCCPDGFWRKGNVDIVCNKYNIEQVETYQGLVDICKKVCFNV